MDTIPVDELADILKRTGETVSTLANRLVADFALGNVPEDFAPRAQAILNTCLAVENAARINQPN